MLISTISKILFLIILLSSCAKDKKSEINLLKHKYSPEVINYFYKVAFHSDADSKVYPISKWGKDIYWYIELDTLPGDRSVVLEAMNELNALELPISFYEVLNKDSANFHILFGSYEELGLPGGFEGTASNLVKDGNILNGAVKIPHDSCIGLKKPSNFLINF